VPFDAIATTPQRIDTDVITWALRRHPVGGRCLLSLVGSSAPGADLIALLDFLARSAVHATVEQWGRESAALRAIARIAGHYRESRQRRKFVAGDHPAAGLSLMASLCAGARSPLIGRPGSAQRRRFEAMQCWVLATALEYEIEGNCFDYHLLVVARHMWSAAHLAVCTDLRGFFDSHPIEPDGRLDDLRRELVKAQCAASTRWPALDRSIKALAQRQRRPLRVSC
jgi:hypothetical protein